MHVELRAHDTQNARTMLVSLPTFQFCPVPWVDTMHSFTELSIYPPCATLIDPSTAHPGSAIDTAKAVSAATGLPLISIPTTYSGAEWTSGWGSRNPDRRVKEGGTGARMVAVLYEPLLTLDLPRAETAGTALNALDHCAEALYMSRRTSESDSDALEGARLIAQWLPAVLANGHDVEARTELLRGSMHAGASLRVGFGLAHALSQALGGWTGGSHGGFNALCLPAVLRFNAEVAAEPISRLASAMGVADAAVGAEALANLGGFTSLRALGVDEADLPAIAQAAVTRLGARLNPRKASAAEAEALLRSIY
jgi:maleylacetate reductase